MMKHIPTRILLTATLTAVAADAASAATLVLFDFEGDSLVSVDTDTDSTVTSFADQATGNSSTFLGSATGASVKGFVIEDLDGTGVGTATSRALGLALQREHEVGFTSATPPVGFAAASTWFEFTLTPGVGLTLDLDTLSLDVSFFSSLAASTTGARFVLSADTGSGFASVDTPKTPTKLVNTGDTAYENVSFDLSSIVLGTDQAVTFRLDPQTTDNNNGNISQRRMTLDNVTVVGEVVPEPGSLALIGLGGLLVVRRRRA